MTEVAMAYAQPFDDVWGQPYHRTLVAYAGLQEKRRIDLLENRAREHRFARTLNAALLDARAFQREQSALLAALGKGPANGEVMTNEQVLAFHAALLAAGQRREVS